MIFYWGAGYFFFIFFLGLGLLSLALGLGRRARGEGAETLTAYECGFQPMCNVRIPFSLQFYLVAIIFLLFDIELVLILPYLADSEGNSALYIFLFFVVLLVGLIHESNEGSFDWR
uniref:NADH-ubiquinone oxidoreductase chain 3 n=1 Tax=Cerastoderma edule TaxID=55710 RepID=A0A343F4F7_CERED|nr:NADH dehydrogenase subunit 3 [Cerastoderma edule]ASQ40455.1 NADH dehydrogenase subunit 3 [Cerastoderma edule]